MGQVTRIKALLKKHSIEALQKKKLELDKRLLFLYADLSVDPSESQYDLENRVEEFWEDEDEDNQEAHDTLELLKELIEDREEVDLIVQAINWAKHHPEDVKVHSSLITEPIMTTSLKSLLATAKKLTAKTTKEQQLVFQGLKEYFENKKGCKVPSSAVPVNQLRNHGLKNLDGFKINMGTCWPWDIGSSGPKNFGIWIRNYVSKKLGAEWKVTLTGGGYPYLVVYRQL